MNQTCAFAPCDNDRNRKSSLCASHKSQKSRGKELTPIAPKMTDAERFWSKVDRSGTCWPWASPLGADGYGRIMIGGRAGKYMLAHRFSYEMANGPITAGADIDHQCLNRSCVNPAHLREASRKQNMENRAGLSKNNKSGARGVSWCRPLSKWHAQITHNQANVHLGYFETIAEADAVVTAKRLELFTHNELDRMAA